MSDRIPETKEEVEQQITELLGVTPETSDRGRLFHLLNALSKFGGGGGTIDPAEVVGLGGAYYFGEFNAVDTVAEVQRETRNVHLKNGILTIPRSAIDGDQPFNELSLVAQGFVNDFVVYLQVSEQEQTAISRLNTYTLNRVGEDRYSLNNLQFTVMDIANVIQPELQSGMTVTLSAYPIPKGSGSLLALGSHLLTTNIVGVDVTSVSDFVGRYRFYGNRQGGTDTGEIMNMTALYIYNNPNSAPLNKLVPLQQLARSGLAPQDGFGVIIEVFQNGQILGGCTARLDAGLMRLDETNNTWEIPISTGTDLIGDVTITADLENPATINVYLA